MADIPQHLPPTQPTVGPPIAGPPPVPPPPVGPPPVGPPPVPPPAVAPPPVGPPPVAPPLGEPATAEQPATPRRRRRWPYLALAAILVFLLGAGASYLLTKPAQDDLRDQRDEAQGQLDQANDQLTQVNEQLAAQKHIASAAQAAADACQRLSSDAQTLSDDMDALQKLLADPSNYDVAPGSPEEQKLFDQLDTLTGSITFEQGAVASDAAACKSAAADI